MPPTAVKERVRWTEVEARQIVDRFAELRAANLLAPYTTLLEQAQEVLPPDRRRTCPSLQVYGHEVNRLLKLKLAEMTAKLRQPLRPAEDSEPTIVTVEVPKLIEVEKAVDPAEVLKGLSVGTLLGTGIDRLLQQLGAKTPELPKVEPTPRQLTQRAEELAKVDKRVRVMVVGLFPENVRYVQEKCSTLSRINVTVCDSEENKIPNAHVDYVMVMRRLVSHKKVEQVRDIHGRDRIVYVEGGQTELMQKLANLNSLSHDEH